MIAIPVLHVITDLSTGGTQMALLRLLRGIDRNRFAPHVCCLLDGTTPVARAIRELDIAVTGLGMTSVGRAGALWRFYRLIETTRPVIVHAWLFHAVLLSRLVGRMAGVEIVISSRRNVNLGNSVREMLNRITIGIDDRVIAVSQAAGRVEIERGRASPDKVVVIPNGIDIDDYAAADPRTRAEVRRRIGIPLEARLVGTVGRLVSEKRTEGLIRAAVRVFDRFADSRLIVVGDGRERAMLERLAAELGAGERIRFLGEREDVPWLLTGLDLFALSSDEEGMPNAVLEAMASGVPVVATAVGGTSEVIEHGVSGVLVPPGDPGALAEGIESVLGSPEFAGRIAANARRRVSRMFSISYTIERTGRVYEDLVKEKFGLRFAVGEGWIET